MNDPPGAEKGYLWKIIRETGFCGWFLFVLPHDRTYPSWREKKVPIEDAKWRSPVTSWLPRSVAYRGSVRAEAGSSRFKAPLRAVLDTYAQGRVWTPGGCVPAGNLLRAEVLLLRAEGPKPKNNSFGVCRVSVTSGVDRKLLCFASRWLRGCIWNIIWTVRAAWRRGSGVTEWWGGGRGWGDLRPRGPGG